MLLWLLEIRQIQQVRRFFFTHILPHTESVAKEIGLAHISGGNTVTGSALQGINSAEFTELISSCSVFARVLPEQVPFDFYLDLFSPET